MESPALTSAELVGLLADPVRLRFVAALVLGADSLDGARGATGLDLKDLSRAQTRLADAGLIIEGDDGAIYVVEAAFRAAARHAATSAPSVADHFADVAGDDAKVLRAFVRDGRLTSLPSSEKKRIAVLEWLAPNFEPGQRYSEKMVNLILGKFHADTAALRRYLVDYGFLSRENSEYWRTGGRVDV